MKRPYMVTTHYLTYFDERMPAAGDADRSHVGISIPAELGAGKSIGLAG